MSDVSVPETAHCLLKQLAQLKVSRIFDKKSKPQPLRDGRNPTRRGLVRIRDDPLCNLGGFNCERLSETRHQPSDRGRIFSVRMRNRWRLTCFGGRKQWSQWNDQT
jgi:hypothetical protein